MQLLPWDCDKGAEVMSQDQKIIDNSCRVEPNATRLHAVKEYLPPLSSCGTTLRCAHREVGPTEAITQTRNW